MEVDFVTKELAIGGMPVSPEDFEELKGLGIDVILSVQEPEDLTMYGLNPEAVFHVATQAGLMHYQVPIRDFDDVDLEVKLDEAVELLEGLIERGYTVYLHCTYGVQRSPTVAAAYLMKVRNISAQEAVEIVQNLHPSQPLEHVLERWAGNL